MTMAEKKPQVAPADDPKNHDTICTLLSEGIPLRQILRDNPGMPGSTAFYARIDKDSSQFDPVLAERIARARTIGFDVIADSCLEIADDARNDWVPAASKDGEEPAERFNSEHVQRSKLRIDTRLKLLAKWDPKRYGEKVTQEITGKDGAPLMNYTDEQIDARILALQNAKT